MAPRATHKQQTAGQAAFFAGAAAAILDSIPDGFIALDRDWRIIHVNRRVCEMWEAARESVLGRILWERFPKIVGTPAGDALRRAVETGCGSEYEAFSPVSRRWLWVRAAPIADGITGVYCRDITDRKTSEDALRTAHEHTAEILESIADAFYAVDRDWRFTYVNRRAEELWGKARNELIGCNLWEAFPSIVGNPSFEQHFRVMRERQPVEFEVRSALIGRWVAVNLYPSRNGGLAAYFRDIGERKAAEIAREQMNELLEQRVAEREESLRRERSVNDLLVKSSGEAIVGWDTGLAITVWNPMAETMTGRSAAEALGKPVLAVFPSDGAAESEAAIRGALAGESLAVHGRRYPGAGTGSGFYDALYSPLRDHHGTIIGGIAFVRDTTERHRIEEQLRQSQKMEAVGQLTGGVAHDFNNLLTAIIGNVEMVTTRLADGDPAKRFAEAALRAAARGAKLTEHLLAFARRRELRPEPVNANDLLREQRMLYRKAVGDAIEVVLELQDGLWTCNIDTTQFEAAILNLAGNARDAMAGMTSGRFTIATENLTTGAVEDVDLPPGDYVRLSIGDTGAGMPPEVLARAFEPFFTTKDVGKGTGLGLSQVYGFAKQAGGVARVESRPGAGTVVRLYLPRKQAAVRVAPRGTPPDAEAPTLQDAILLVVEDDAEVRQMMVTALGHLGCRVLVAGNGHEALAILERGEPIDLLLSDIVMPAGISGVDLARAARRARPDLKVLLSTGHAGDDARRVEIAAEFPVIAKPFRIGELGRMLGAILAG